MQNDSKKQLPVLIALSAVLVLAVGFSVMRSMNKPEPPAAKQEAQEEQQLDRKPIAVPDSETEDGLPLEASFVGNPPRDPFKPMIIAQADAPSTNPRVVPQSGQSNNGSRIAQVPPLPLPGLEGQFRVEGPDGMSFPAEPEKPPFTATGVVRGAYDIAILRGDGGGRHFVREGQSVGDGYVVKSISPVGVVLNKKDKSMFLQLGGAQDARTGERARQEGR